MHDVHTTKSQILIVWHHDAIAWNGYIVERVTSLKKTWHPCWQHLHFFKISYTNLAPKQANYDSCFCKCHARDIQTDGWTFFAILVNTTISYLKLSSNRGQLKALGPSVPIRYIKISSFFSFLACWSLDCPLNLFGDNCSSPILFYIFCNLILILSNLSIQIRQTNHPTYASKFYRQNIKWKHILLIFINHEIIMLFKFVCLVVVLL